MSILLKHHSILFKKTTIAKRRPLSYSRINSPVFVSRANLPICSHTISANITVGEWTIFSQATVRNRRSPWDVTLSPIKYFLPWYIRISVLSNRAPMLVSTGSAGSLGARNSVSSCFQGSAARETPLLYLCLPLS